MRKESKQAIRLAVISLTFALSPITLNAFAQEETEALFWLDTVVVTANKKEATLLNTKGTINVITAEDIENCGQRELAQIIATIPGIINDSSGAGTYFSFRGTRSSSSGGALILIDGRPLNFGRSGYSEIDSIPVDIIDRIEVIKSPPASLYGANSARGVINIITKKGVEYKEKRIEVTSRLSTGSWDTYKNYNSFAWATGPWDYNLSTTYEDSDGYRHTNRERTSLGGHVGYDLGDGIRLDTDVSWYSYEGATGLKLKHWQLGDPTQNDPWNSETSPTYRYSPNEHDRELLNGSVRYRCDRDEWLFDGTINISHRDEIYDYLKYWNKLTGSSNRYNKTYREDRDEEKLELKIFGGKTLSGGELSDTLIFGCDYASTEFDQTRDYLYATSITGSMQTNIDRAAIDFDRDIQGLFLNNELSFRQWGLSSGARYEIVKFDVKNNEPKTLDESFYKLGWDVAPSYSPNENSSIYLSLGKSYWYPTAFYYTTAMQYVDPDNRPEDLKEEQYMNYELGYKNRLSEVLNYSVSFYRTEIDNKYMPFYNDAGSYKGYKHIGDSVHQGVDIEADGKPRDWFGYRLGFTWLDAEWGSGRARVSVHGATPADDSYDTVSVAGKKVYRVPEYEYRVGADFYPDESWKFSMDLHGFGESYIDALNRYKNGSVNLVDAKLTYYIKGWELYVLSSNIFDEEYESIFNTKGKRNSDSTPGHDYYPRDGQYFEIGATIKF